MYAPARANFVPINQERFCHEDIVIETTTGLELYIGTSFKQHEQP